jgi:hypothetical protein
MGEDIGEQFFQQGQPFTNWSKGPSSSENHASLQGQAKGLLG